MLTIPAELESVYFDDRRDLIFDGLEELIALGASSETAMNTLLMLFSVYWNVIGQYYRAFEGGSTQFNRTVSEK